MPATAKKYAVLALSAIIGALGVYLVRTLPEGFLFPVLCLSASVAGLLVVLPYMAFCRRKRLNGRIAMNHDYEVPTGLSLEEQRQYRSHRAARDLCTLYLLLAVLSLVAWWVLKRPH